jgi:hypothetical protein
VLSPQKARTGLTAGDIRYARVAWSNSPGALLDDPVVRVLENATNVSKCWY